MSTQRWWADRRAWALLVVVLAISLAEVLLPDVPLTAFLVIPVVGSAVLGSPWLTAVLAGLVLLGSIPLQVFEDYPTDDIIRRQILVLLASVIAIWLAAYVQRSQHQRDEAFALARASEERFRLVAENSADIVVVVKDGRVDWISPAVEGAFGAPPDEWIGRPATEIVLPEFHDLLMEITADALHGASRVGRARARSPRGAVHWVEANVGPYRDASGIVGATASMRVIDDVIKTESELDRRARFDELTGVPNRHEALIQLAHLDDSRRRPGEGSAVLFIDLDDFKDVNDIHGHAAGDTVLRTVAARIGEVIRGGDLVARMGGDELLVVLKDMHSLEDAGEIAEKLRRSVREPIALPTGQVTSTVSIGVVWHEPGESVDEVLARADAAMYEAKRSGRDQVVVLGNTAGT
ncbi:MAG: diguanylate cyclase [Actinomycetales bacterium]|nr:diguanylate cyclase [Actinomycetales bacterium]